jgi:hypothetical protein
MTNRKTALVTAVILLASLPGYSQAVDPKIHTLCSEAKDYACCVKPMKGFFAGDTAALPSIHRFGTACTPNHW